MKRFKELCPPSLWQTARNAKHQWYRGIRRCAESLGCLVERKQSHYAAKPSEFDLKKTQFRWDKPSAMLGVTYDLDAMEALLEQHCHCYMQDFLSLPAYAEMTSKGFGPGYPYVDAFVLYSMLRDLKPRRYLETGSGLSTVYASEAIKTNTDTQCSLTCIEPYPFDELRSLKGINLLVSEAQSISPEEFLKLERNDVLFIDTSHIVKIDGEVPYLFLEILPQLKPGVMIHIHDIPFPFNTPYPASYWTLLEHSQSPHWPMYWNEAMLLQALLSGSSTFELVQSLPIIRHFREPSLRAKLPIYQPLSEQPNTFSSIWLRKR